MPFVKSLDPHGLKSSTPEGELTCLHAIVFLTLKVRSSLGLFLILLRNSAEPRRFALNRLHCLLCLAVFETRYLVCLVLLFVFFVGGDGGRVVVFGRDLSSFAYPPGVGG